MEIWISVIFNLRSESIILQLVESGPGPSGFTIYWFSGHFMVSKRFCIVLKTGSKTYTMLYCRQFELEPRSCDQHQLCCRICCVVQVSKYLIYLLLFYKEIILMATLNLTYLIFILLLFIFLMES